MLIQILVGLSIACWSTGALVYLQQLFPERAGMATGLYMTFQQLSPVATGLVIGPVAERYGVMTGFAAVAALLAVALIVLQAAHHILVTAARSGGTKADHSR
jgi:MFS family permease